MKEGADKKKTRVAKFTFTIHARNKDDVKKTEGGDDFTVDITHLPTESQVPKVNVKDNGDGSYLVSYKLKEPGEYSLDVMLNGEHIHGSPWKQQM